MGPEAHKAFFEANDETLDQAPVYKFMVPVFGKGVRWLIAKVRKQIRSRHSFCTVARSGEAVPCHTQTPRLS